ncbi:hypothetical protein P7K49_005782 [Saguinus oedipus]|uniref:Uncharacterized protein n=1 Tax=Saguinus oedipus TaxID=9490 RepID=A0ABQ9W0J3_SAGOE|nr:hypothetical protein P7K49_005782 [Saguinus oedipus]
MAVALLSGRARVSLGSWGFIPKTAATPKASSSWQTSRPPAQGTPRPPQAKPPPKASTQLRPNYAASFSVIGTREERGVRAPSFAQKPKVSENDFEDLLSNQGFSSRSDKKGPKTIAEMRKQDLAKDTDPLKLKALTRDPGASAASHGASISSQEPTTAGGRSSPGGRGGLRPGVQGRARPQAVLLPMCPDGSVLARGAPRVSAEIVKGTHLLGTALGAQPPDPGCSLWGEGAAVRVSAGPKTRPASVAWLMTSSAGHVRL